MKIGNTLLAACLVAGSLLTSCDEGNNSKGGGLSSDPNLSKPKSNTSVSSTNNPMEMKPEASGTVVGPTTTIKFDKMTHDFGRIKQDTKNEHTFYFTNTGEHPVMFSSAKGSCGCTVPQYPKEPVLPGQKGEIKVVFSSGKKKNKQNKSVTLVGNTTPAATKLYIKAFVEVDETAAQ